MDHSVVTYYMFWYFETGNLMLSKLVSSFVPGPFSMNPDLTDIAFVSILFPKGVY